MVGSADSSSNDKWLVKSGERVLGPYSTEALNQLVRDKEVVVIDEVMAPQGRWTYIRDVKAFESIVEEIRRGLMQSREDTEVQGYTPNATLTDTSLLKAEAERIARPITEAGLPLSTAMPVSLPSSGSQAPATASVMTPRDRSKDLNNPTDAASQSKSYARPQVGGKGATYVGAAVLFLACGFIIYSVMSKPLTARSVVGSSSQLGTQASVAWKRGEFERSLELYRALDHEQPGRPATVSRLAILMMKIEGQTVEAKRVIESAESGATDPESRAQLALAKGLADLQSDDAKEAVAHFSQAGSSWIAKFDAGVAEAALKNWPAAVQNFETAGQQAVAYLSLAKTHLSAADSGANKSTSRQLAEVSIEKALSAAPDFEQESLVVGAYLDATSGQAKRAAARVLQAIEVDPNQTVDHFHDPSLNLENVSWTKLLPMCRSIHSELHSHLSGALLGLCLAKANQLEEASKAIEAEIGADPNNSYLHAVSAYLNLLADREDAARASLTLSAKNGSSRLAQILSARLCMHEGQTDCAEEGWSKLAADAQPPIAAITSLAQVRKEKGDSSTANALLVKADSMSPSYLPLLRLREDASR